MIDSDLYLRNPATDLTADELTPTGVDMGADLVSQTYMVHVPEAGGTNPTLDVKIQESTDNSTYTNIGQFPQITAVGTYYLTLQCSERYRRYVADVGGTSPDFGAVIIAPVPAGRDKSW